jgi:hypothetical protein
MEKYEIKLFSPLAEYDNSIYLLHSSGLKFVQNPVKRDTQVRKNPNPSRPTKRD